MNGVEGARLVSSQLVLPRELLHLLVYSVLPLIPLGGLIILEPLLFDFLVPFSLCLRT